MPFILTAIVAIVASTGLAIASYLAITNAKNIRKVRLLSKQLKKIERSFKQSQMNGKEIERVLIDQRKSFDALLLLLQYSHNDNSSYSAQLERIRQRKNSSDKHFLELQLFSSDELIRESAMQELAGGLGDLETLNILGNLRKVLPLEQCQIVEDYERRLTARLHSIIVSYSRDWTGLP